MKQPSQTAALTRQRLAHDPHRPRYHFSPPNNWMNDPNGLIHWRGRYHLFYQHNPTAPHWGNIHWGHAASDDLIHWIDLPIALAPTAGGSDKDGCWSGVVIDHQGTPTLLYTGVFPEAQCLATGSDDLITWEKYPANPVIAAPPNHLDVVGFRDPCVWQDNGYWYMTIGTGVRNMGGAVLLYRSRDLLAWEYVSVLLAGDKASTGEMWECPAFFPLGNKYVLMISLLGRAGTVYFVGSFDGARFVPEIQAALDYGLYFFAPQTLLDAAGRRLMIGWIGEGRSDATQHTAGWSGLQSIPRQLTLRSDGRLGITPVPELKTLRGRHSYTSNIVLDSAADHDLPDARGTCLELIAEFEPGAAEVFGLKLLCSPDGEEQTLIAYTPQSSQLVIDGSHSSIDAETQRDIQRGVLRLAPHETLKLHIFLDQSVIEVFANEYVCLTSRVYPSRPDSVQVRLFAHGGRVTLLSLDVWEMNSIWA